MSRIERWCFALLACLLCTSLEASTSVSLVFAGDTVLDDDPGDLIAKGGDPFAGLASVFAAADIRLLNLECVIATQGEPADKFYTFRAHPRVVPVLKRHVDAVALANNHSGDYGPQAFAEMLSLLAHAGLPFVGGGHDLTQAHAPQLFERRGLRVAVLSYNEFHPRSFEAGFNRPGVAWSEDAQVVRDIKAARSVHRADVVIPIMHWGWENEPQSNARQQHLARLMIEAGADAVLGAHPHVKQEVGLHLGKPVVYSVGNFVMKETDNAQQRQGWMVRLELDAKGVRLLQTVPVQLDLQGIPSLVNGSEVPCWVRGDVQIGVCNAH
jgi:poly-gamma-glutamate capsule biosynthesis protein CapA/YwtB (metallophosphatase superfamily)